MKRVVLAVACLCIPGLVLAAPRRAAEKFEEALKRLDPSERVIQVCSMVATERIASDNKTYRPDRAVMDSISPPKEAEHKISGNGGAFRSGHAWYQFSYTCTTTPDDLKVVTFEFRVGEKIPQSKWEEFGLWQ